MKALYRIGIPNSPTSASTFNSTADSGFTPSGLRSAVEHGNRGLKRVLLAVKNTLSDSGADYCG